MRHFRPQRRARFRAVVNLPVAVRIIEISEHYEVVRAGENERFPEPLRPLRIPVPPLPLQHEFANLVDRVERLRCVQKEALRQAEHLFQSLLHQAFSADDEIDHGNPATIGLSLFRLPPIGL